MSSDPLWKRLRSINWADLEIASEDGKKLTKLLQDLAAKKEARAMKASQKLWSLVKANPSFSEPIRPYLQEIFHISEPAVRDEINDLMDLG
jgi:hypothetical protein